MSLLLPCLSSPFPSIILTNITLPQNALFFNTFSKKAGMCRQFKSNVYLAASTFRDQKSLILSHFQSLNFKGQGVCTLPLVFASESVTGSFLQLYHYLVYKVCISALRQQLIAVSKQSIEKIPSFFCRQIKVVFLLPHMKITSALTVSVTANRRAFILCTHSI